MRTELQNYVGKMVEAKAHLAAIKHHRNGDGVSALLENVCFPQGEIIDHMWVVLKRGSQVNQNFRGNTLPVGEDVVIYAKVDIYIKGFRGKKTVRSDKICMDYTFNNARLVG